MKKTLHSTATLILCLAMSSNTIAQERDNATNLIQIVKTKGLPGLASEITAKRALPFAIPNPAAKTEPDTPQAWELVSLKRDFGKILLDSIEKGERGASASIEDAERLTLVGNWLTETPDYGNAVVALAAEQARIKTLIKILLEGEANSNAVEKAIGASVKQVYEPDFWEALVKTNWPSVKIKREDDSSKSMNLATILATTADAYADHNVSEVMKAIRSGISKVVVCYDIESPEALLLIHMYLACDSIALEVVAEIWRKTGAVPLSKDAFCEAATKHAKHIMDLKDGEERIGGRFTALEVWDALNSFDNVLTNKNKEESKK